MPPQYLIRGPNQTTTLTDITEYFRLYEMDLTMNAEEGSTATSTATADDPDGAFDYVGHRYFRVLETTATGSNQIIYSGYTAEREWHRGDAHRVGVSRVVDITLTDINTVLTRRIIRGSDGNRPQELDYVRMQWAEASNEGALIDDTRYLSATNGVMMDAVDYRGQYLADVFNDCGNASGKDWFLWHSDVGFSLWYDFSDSENHRSPLRLTNDLDAVDDVLTFAISLDTKLRRDPSRVFSGVQLPYDGGTVYETDANTSNTFALRGRDVVMPSYNVKSLAKATARARRYLVDLGTEEDVITTTVVLPAAIVNFLMAGMAVQFQASHLSGYGTFTWLRAINRNVRQISEEFYAVTLDLSASAPAVVPPPGSEAYAILYGPWNNASAHFPDVLWAGTGDDPPAGQPGIPKQGLVEYVLDSPERSSSYRYLAISVTGTGTIDIEAVCTANHAVVGDVSDTFGVFKNGVLVDSFVSSGSGTFPYSLSTEATIITSTAVVPGDVISCEFSSTWGSIVVPWGSGSLGNHLIVTGTLA